MKTYVWVERGRAFSFFLFSRGGGEEQVEKYLQWTTGEEEQY